MLRPEWNSRPAEKTPLWCRRSFKLLGKLPAAGDRTDFTSRRGCSGNRYRLVCFLLSTRPALISLPLMATSFKQRGCVAAAAFLSMLSLSQAQTNPAPAGPAQAPNPIRPAENPPMLLVQAPAQAASPAQAKSGTTAATTVQSPTLTEADANIESGGVGVREFQGDDVGQVLRLLARQAKVNMVVSDAVTGAVTMRLEDVTALQAISIIAKAKGLS